MNHVAKCGAFNHPFVRWHVHQQIFAYQSCPRFRCQSALRHADLLQWDSWWHWLALCERVDVVYRLGLKWRNSPWFATFGKFLHTFSLSWHPGRPVTCDGSGDWQRSGTASHAAPWTQQTLGQENTARNRYEFNKNQGSIVARSARRTSGMEGILIAMAMPWLPGFCGLVLEGEGISGISTEVFPVKGDTPGRWPRSHVWLRRRATYDRDGWLCTRPVNLKSVTSMLDVSYFPGGSPFVNTKILGMQKLYWRNAFNQSTKLYVFFTEGGQGA